MSNKPFIQKYAISGLFGYKDFELSFDDKVKILIGENGYGKTTILNSLAFLLKGDYINLLRIKFSEISISFDDSHSYHFTYNDLKSYVHFIEQQKKSENSLMSYISNNLNLSTVDQLINLAKTSEEDFYKELKSNVVLKDLPSRYVFQFLQELSDQKTKFKVFSDLSTYINSTGYKILYYPTYRRVEVDFKSLQSNNSLHGVVQSNRIRQEENILLSDNSIMKFGINDVENRKNKICEEISKSSILGFAAVSGGMISKLLERESDVSDSITHNFDINEIQIVLGRVGDNMSQEDKNTILSQIKEDPSLSKQNSYLRYFLDQLLSVYKKQERFDSAIKQFVTTCNSYLYEKEFSYDESTVSLQLRRSGTSNDSGELMMSQLSSGEKQIVSIFSQLYLEPDKKYVILFDEPELSLSIYWQEKLLPDMFNSGRCVFMLAVTHSPFVFNNEYKTSAVGLKEFIKNGE